MSNLPIKVVYFDLGETLGSAVLSPSPVRLVAFDIFPYTKEVLSSLLARGIRLGVISNTGSDTLATINPILDEVGILEFFDASLLIYSGDVGMQKDSPEVFRLAAKRAGFEASPGQVMFVGEDNSERVFALDAGLQVAPHPLLVDEVIDGSRLRFARVTPGDHLGWEEQLLRTPFVPMHRDGPRVYGCTSQRGLRTLSALDLEVVYLGDPDVPKTSDLYLLRDDLAESTGPLEAIGEAAAMFADPSTESMVLGTEEKAVIVAVPGGRSVEEIHFHKGQHGHNLKLVYDTEMLRSEGGGVSSWAETTQGLPSLTDAEMQVIGAISGQQLQWDIAWLSGSEFGSRHIQHEGEGNSQAVSALAGKLVAIGQGALTVRLHSFSHEGQTLHNVEAELPGLRPDAVLVTAHLDSTAAATPDSDAKKTAAPGADDDASGVSAVLAVASAAVELARTAKFPHTIKFVLFNAEEHGLVGSHAYARWQRSQNASITSVLQMDMIAFNSRPPADWEIHYGFAPNAAVEKASQQVAAHVISSGVALRNAHLTPTITSPILHPPALGGDDPAAGRSDHAAFQLRGYPACVVSEKFFANPNVVSDIPDGNPHYHQDDDRVEVLDLVFATEIARVVGATAIRIAKSLPTSSVSPTIGNESLTEGASSMAFEIDVRQQAIARLQSDHLELAAPQNTNPLTGTSRKLTHSTSTLELATAGDLPNDNALVQGAIEIVRLLSGLNEFAGGASGFDADGEVSRTAAGTPIVHLQQHYRGIPVFQMTRTARYEGAEIRIAGDHVPITSQAGSLTPSISSLEAFRAAAKHLETLNAESSDHVDHWGQPLSSPTINANEFVGKVETAFGGPDQPTTIQCEKLDSPAQASLVWFYQGENRGVQTLTLCWQFVINLPNEDGQYLIVVGADKASARTILYATETSHNAVHGQVYPTNGGQARDRVPFPRPLTDYPLPDPVTPVPAGFPGAWTDADKTRGNLTIAKVVDQVFPRIERLGTGTRSGNNIDFLPADPHGPDQQVLNEFYFCNYMHDFFFLLGFREADGSFSGDDAVKAFAHPRSIRGTANMSTPPKGMSPTMNMGDVPIRDAQGNIVERRHTALDADVVFHEYVHGVSNRLVGGPASAGALTLPQSRGMGEGWSDYFALTIQNFHPTTERTTTGDWVVKRPGGGIRRFPYDDQYPQNYGDVASLSSVHNIGEVWCAALMHMNRQLESALASKTRAYHIAWQIVVDGMKLSPSNPSFLDARDGILSAIGDLERASWITVNESASTRRAAWIAFAGFGMGVNASSAGAFLDFIVEDFHVPNEPAMNLHGEEIQRLGTEAPVGFGHASDGDLQAVMNAWSRLSSRDQNLIMTIVRSVLGA